MKALLICPAERPAVSHLSRFTPLAAVPLLGESLLEYWLTHLALSGIKEARILSHDRTDQIRAIAGNGARWGLAVEIVQEARELTPAQAQIKYAQDFPANTDQYVIATMNRFPGGPDVSIFDSYQDLFAALAAWMPRANTVDRVGIREVKPGIWAGTHAYISPEAQLQAPCWIGQSAYIGPRAVVGPMAIVEDRAFLEAGAEVVSGVIGPDTFVGQLAVLKDSFAWGSTLVNWKTGSCIQVPDAFVLSALRRPAATRQPLNFLSRLTELLFPEEKRPAELLQTFLLNKKG